MSQSSSSLPSEVATRASDQARRAAESSRLSSVSTIEALDRIAAAVRSDALAAPAEYLAVSRVPHGGE